MLSCSSIRRSSSKSPLAVVLAALGLIPFAVGCSVERQPYSSGNNGTQAHAGTAERDGIGEAVSGTGASGAGGNSGQAHAGAAAGPSIGEPVGGMDTTSTPYEQEGGTGYEQAGGAGAGATIATAATGATTAPTAPDEECSGVSKQAETELLPSDIIWAIDTSGTMASSFPAIETALNDFAQKMDAAAIDAHIVLIAGAGEVAAWGGSGFCMPTPLGSGQCGNSPVPNGSALDSNEPRFLHVDAAFGMTQAIPYVLDNFPNYRHLLRPNARTQFVVTEDSAPLMTADEVKNHIEGRAQALFTALPAWDPPLKEGTWQFNGVVCASGMGLGPCMLAIAPPQTTLDLISSTGGLVSDLQDAATGNADPFADLLNKLAEAVIVGAKVSCEYEIPPPPRGMVFDPEKVNVEYINGAQDVTVIPQLPAARTCDGEISWLYDDPVEPTRVVLCPAACELVQNDPQARVDAKFGCKTIVLLE